MYDAYRPQKAVENFKKWVEDVGDTRIKDAFYPEIDKSVLFEQGHISNHSGHSRGSAVDRQ
ncbi:MAG: hypothetical protein IJF99_08955 [Methanobrevibacter sp.]|nr:hypothetical protein [Methanobrevibacter sp.]